MYCMYSRGDREVVSNSQVLRLRRILVEGLYLKPNVDDKILEFLWDETFQGLRKSEYGWHMECILHINLWRSRVSAVAGF